ncbi:hypothetical protein [Micromonospora sp. NPDC049679]|uniref:hypothetical protein n=1 Tax=Micromonospora sp. NPDC049679 TaxID=3155920 RepID=UPI0033DC0440
MPLLAIDRPLWSAALRALRKWTGVAMTAMMLALSIGHGQPAAPGLPTMTAERPAPIVTTATATHRPPEPVDVRDRADTGHTTAHLLAAPADTVLPIRAGERRAQSWDTSPRDPGGDTYRSTPGERAPPRR